MIILPLLAVLAVSSHAVPRATRDASKTGAADRLSPGRPQQIEPAEIVTDVGAAPASDGETLALPTQAQFWATELERSREQLGGETKAMRALGLTPPLFYKIKGLVGETAPLPRDGTPVQTAKARLSMALRAHLQAFGDPDKALDHFNWTPRYSQGVLAELGHRVTARYASGGLKAAPKPAGEKGRGRRPQWIDHDASSKGPSADEKAVKRRRKSYERKRSKAAAERTSDLPTLQDFSQEQTIRQLVGIFSGNREKINAKLSEFAESRGSQWQPLSQAEIDTLRADKRSLAQRERDFLKRHLDAAGGDYAATAKSLGIVGEDGGVAVVKNKLRQAGLLGL